MPNQAKRKERRDRRTRLQQYQEHDRANLRQQLHINHINTGHRRLHTYVLTRHRRPKVQLTTVNRHRIKFNIPRRPPPSHARQHNQQRHIRPFKLRRNRRSAIRRRPSQTSHPTRTRQPIHRRPTRLRRSLFHTVQTSRNTKQQSQHPHKQAASPQHTTRQQTSELLHTTSRRDQNPNKQQCSHVTNMQQPMPTTKHLNNLNQRNSIRL